MERNWNFLLGKVLFVAALLAATGAYAIPQEPCEVKTPVCCQEPQPGPFAFAYPKDMGLACPSDFYVYGEFLAMQAKQEGMEFAIKESLADITSKKSINSGVVKSLPKDSSTGPWGYGFRAGMGFYLTHDSWNIDATWTFLRVKKDTSTSANIESGEALFPLLSPLLFESQEGDNIVSGASLKWKLDINTFDLRMGKPYHVSRYFITKPFIALRAAWIDQDIASQYIYNLGVEPETIYGVTRAHFDNDFWGIGPRVGVDTEWCLGAGWAIFGNVSGSILFGKFDLSYKNDFLNPGHYDLDQDFYTNAPNAEVVLGIQWGSHFSKDKYHVLLKAAYEFHYWWNQNQLRRFDVAYLSNTDVVSRGNLSLNGVSVRVQLDF